MSRLRLDALVKTFGATRAVDGVTLDIAEGEFLAVLGPSGCGKTTLLRLIAGFEHPEAGAIAFDDQIVADARARVPPEERRVGIVFQSYALWPHMNVRRNVGYALEVAGLRGADYQARVAEALATVGLEGFEARKPAQLSGGQRQRVALARCLAMRPRVVLLDEPLANLDVHLRASMLDEFRDFHAKTGATMVYITHDQGEAMALADRIAVMDQGRVAQVASPRALYREPASRMVAGFVGRGAVVEARIATVDGTTAMVEVFGRRVGLRCTAGQRPGVAALCLRPEDFAAAPDGFAARVERAVYRGAVTEIDARVGDALVRLDLPDGAAPGDVVKLALTGGWVIPD